MEAPILREATLRSKVQRKPWVAGAAQGSFLKKSNRKRVLFLAGHRLQCGHSAAGSKDFRGVGMIVSREVRCRSEVVVHE